MANLRTVSRGNFVNPNAKQNDISLMGALVVCGLIATGYIYLNPISMSVPIDDVKALLVAHTGMLIGLVTCVGINTYWALNSLARLIELRKQGSRLRSITKKEENTKSTLVRDASLTFVLSIAAFAIGSVLTRPITSEILFLKNISPHLIVAGCAFQYAMTTFAITWRLLGLDLVRKFLNRITRKNLEPVPRLFQGIVLGSTNENDETLSPTWIVQDLKGLNGNLLVTGSIGSGKTQGTILNYFDQILRNFSPRPSMLAIDPKGTFVGHATKLIEKHNLGNHLVHLSLEGSVKFNPIYSRDAIKSGRFLETAQMLRAAAANFSGGGRSGVDDFWELSAFNLVKNSLVYCAVKYPYYTLNDLYNVIISAKEENLGETFEAARTQKEYSEEEQYNIDCATAYFKKEFDQLDTKVRTGILATATSFLNQFQEFRAAKIFCPEQNEITLESIDQIVDEGKILVVDIQSPALSRSMGTIIKLQFEQSVLNRLINKNRDKIHIPVMIIDEFQDVVSTGAIGTLGDNTYLAKSREAKAITIVASQSLTSIDNAIGSEKAALELYQNFRTRIAGHSTDPHTIRIFQELMGRQEVDRSQHSISELSQKAKRNLLLGGFESTDANISESFSTSAHLEYTTTGKEFSRLKSFECFAQVYDGIQTNFHKLFLKPSYLEAKNTPHKTVLQNLKNAAATIAILSFLPVSSFSFPDVCSVVKTPEFNSCLNFNVGQCMCGFPPRPCAQISYYVPKTFIEVMPNPRSSYFDKLPGAALQLSNLSKLSLPFGAESDDDTQSFQAHTLSVPFVSVSFGLMSCGGTPIERTCFEGMSEHLGQHWSSGSADLTQPLFLAWSAAPKVCLMKGALTSAAPPPEPTAGSAAASCSVSLNEVKIFPPSSHAACNGWGTFYPRNGIYHGPSQTAGSLMVASRIKSISSEVFQSTPSSIDEMWQMISPQSSSCFREGQNVGMLEGIKNVREAGRLLNGKLSGYLYVIWHKVSCCKDLVEVPVARAAIGAMQSACQGNGGI